MDPVGTLRDTGVDPARVQAEVDRLASSSVLHSADALCRLLRFLVQQRLEHPELQLKEYEIATRLLGRPSDFDPRIDPVVRVQVGRLRSKLVEYYATEGSESDLYLRVPKGTYAPDFLPRQRTSSGGLTTVSPDVTTWAEDPPAEPISAERRQTRTAVWLGLVCVSAVAVFGAGWLTGVRSQQPERSAPATSGSRPALSEELNEPLISLWSPFALANRPVLVVVGNSPIAGRAGIDFPNSGPSQDHAPERFEQYAGIGEVFAVSSLHRLLARMNTDIRLKRGQLLSWEDAQNRPVIFVGTPSEDLHLGDLPQRQKFVFEHRNRGPRRELVIRNTSPVSGEQGEYRLDPRRPERADYGLITRTIGFDGASPILILAGITTLGTEAVADFASDSHRVSELVNKLGGALPASFSALLAVEIEGGVPVHTRIVGAAPASPADPR